MSRMQSEDDLVRCIKTDFYPVFQSRDLQPKKTREEEAWNLLRANRGNYTRQVIDQVFDVVDYDPYAPNQRWFGQLLIVPNRNQMFQLPSTVESINRWIDNLLFSGDVLEKRLATAEQTRPKGASKGIATLFLYLQDPKEYNVWLPTTHRSLELLGRIQGLEESDWSKNYPVFNAAAISFRDKHGFEPHEVDWALWMIEMITRNSPALDRYCS
jgi:hypothetical protein